MDKIKATIREQNFMFIICAIVILYSIYSSSKHENYLSSEYGYTVGKTIKYNFADGQKNCIKYKYYVNNVKFVNCVVIDPKISCPINKFYRVKYSKIKPEISELYFTKRVIDTGEVFKAGLNFEKEESK
ncbi:hypothetical protein [Flavobacterium dankookense]|uniref:Uncharacterized protein n=1 Tax=Flavobacterium dankookense TaxID=706186 RepID=A0A4R6Q5X2_9FLAO|nr:hypothetical protein [Flavobacterium dankookense]TDP57380.1 hypothetical protein BC748_2900 [Flavobacterium dankookense]